MKQTKFAISSYQASIFSLSCIPALLMRREFERARWKLPLLGYLDSQFNSFIVRITRSAMNPKLIGERLFDAVEWHLTDPRFFYNPLEWKINEKMIGQVRAPISSFHAHMECDPLLNRYVFNMCDNNQRTRKAIRNQLQFAYRLMQKYPELIKTENPVFVFHAGVASSEEDKEKAFARTRENMEYLAITNHELWVQYGKGRKVIPTIENAANDSKLFLCQTVEDWKGMIRGFEDEIKLTLDYGHLQTFQEEKEKLLKELREGNLGNNIVNLHLHYSPEIDNEIRHVHAGLTFIPNDRMETVQSDIRTIVNRTQIRNQGYVTLEVPSKDPLDYMPTLRPIFRPLSAIHRLRNIMESTGISEWSSYRGNWADQLDSLKIAREMVQSSLDLDIDLNIKIDLNLEPETESERAPILVKS